MCGRHIDKSVKESELSERVRECSEFSESKRFERKKKETSNSKKTDDERKREKVTKRRQRERRKFDSIVSSTFKLTI